MTGYILASQSPRRKQLLEWAELDFEIVVSATDESFSPGLTPEEAAVEIAREKAAAVQAATGTTKTIIAADTIVVLGNRIIGKPKDRAEAVETLTQLSGNTHRVITGVAIFTQVQTYTFYDVTEVEFHPLTGEEIAFYIDKYQPYDKAGAYAIQEWIGVTGIKRINGDFYNVMGLPVSRVMQILKKI